MSVECTAMYGPRFFYALLPGASNPTRMEEAYMENQKTPIRRTYENCALKMEGDKQGKCRVLQIGVCRNAESCAFHKTAAEKRESFAAYCRRMNSLSEDEQKYYADKYHMGTMPWKKGGVLSGEKE